MTSDDFTTQLRERLHRATDHVPLAGAGPDAAVARARTHRRKRRSAVAGLGAVLLTGAAVTTLSTGEDQRTSLATQTELPAGQPVALEWRRAEDGISNVQSSVVDVTSGATYALSTAPGLRTPAEGPIPVSDTVYRLTDDGRWEPTAVGDDSGRPARLAADGGVLYSIGTAAEDRGSIATVVGTSTDGGRTWTEDVIGRADAPNDTLPWLRIDRLGIASAGGRQVAVTSSAFSVDWNEFLGEPTPESAWVRGVVEADGVRLIREEFDEEDGDERAPTEVGFETWDDLGVSGPEAFEAKTAVHVKEGDGWTEVDAGIGADQVMSIRAVGGHFVLRAFEVTDPGTGVGAERTYTSVDGRTWTAVQAPGGHDVVPVGGGFVGLDGNAAGLVRSTGDGGWTSVALSEIDERLEGGSIGVYSAGDLGLAFTVHGSEQGDPAHLVFTPDLQSWTVTPLADVLGTDGMWPSMLEVGADRLVVVGTDGGAGEGPARTVTVVGVPRR